MSPKRPGTHGDHSRFARRESPASGVPALVEDDDATDQYERQEIDESELAIRRDKRNPSDWLAKLQKKHDKLASDYGAFAKTTTETLTKVQVDVGKLSGTLEVLPDLVRSVKDSADRLTAREDQTLRNRLEIDKAEELARIDDTADKRKKRRNFYWTIACSFITGGGATLVLRWIGVL